MAQAANTDLKFIEDLRVIEMVPCSPSDNCVFQLRTVEFIWKCIPAPDIAGDYIIVDENDEQQLRVRGADVNDGDIDVFIHKTNEPVGTIAQDRVYQKDPKKPGVLIAHCSLDLVSPAIDGVDFCHRYTATLYSTLEHQTEAHIHLRHKTSIMFEFMDPSPSWVRAMVLAYGLQKGFNIGLHQSQLMGQQLKQDFRIQSTEKMTAMLHRNVPALTYLTTTEHLEIIPYRPNSPAQMFAITSEHDITVCEETGDNTFEIMDYADRESKFRMIYNEQSQTPETHLVIGGKPNSVIKDDAAYLWPVSKNALCRFSHVEGDEFQTSHASETLAKFQIKPGRIGIAFYFGADILVKALTICYAFRLAAERYAAWMDPNSTQATPTLQYLQHDMTGTAIPKTYHPELPWLDNLDLLQMKAANPATVGSDQLMVLSALRVQLECVQDLEKNQLILKDIPTDKVWLTITCGATWEEEMQVRLPKQWPVGSVTKNELYDNNPEQTARSPLCHIYYDEPLVNEVKMRGRYKVISPSRNAIVANIFIENDDVNVQFISPSETYLKALVVVYAIKRALTSHKTQIIPPLVQQKQQAQATASSAASAPPIISCVSKMQNIILKGASQCADCDEFYWKILNCKPFHSVTLTIICHDNVDTFEVVDNQSAYQFSGEGFSNLDTLMTVKHENTQIGELKSTTKPNEMKLTDLMSTDKKDRNANVVATRRLAADQLIATYVVDVNGVPRAYINRDERYYSYKIEFQGQVSNPIKVLVICYALKMCYCPRKRLSLRGVTVPSEESASKQHFITVQLMPLAEDPGNCRLYGLIKVGQLRELAYTVTHHCDGRAAFEDQHKNMLFEIKGFDGQGQQGIPQTRIYLPQSHYFGIVCQNNGYNSAHNLILTLTESRDPVTNTKTGNSQIKRPDGSLFGEISLNNNTLQIRFNRDGATWLEIAISMAFLLEAMCKEFTFIMTEPVLQKDIGGAQQSSG